MVMQINTAHRVKETDNETRKHNYIITQTIHDQRLTTTVTTTMTTNTESLLCC